MPANPPIWGLGYLCGCKTLRSEDARLPRTCPVHGKEAYCLTWSRNPPRAWGLLKDHGPMPLANAGLEPMKVPAGF